MLNKRLNAAENEVLVNFKMWVRLVTGYAASDHKRADEVAHERLAPLGIVSNEDAEEDEKAENGGYAYYGPENIKGSEELKKIIDRYAKRHIL